MLKFLRKARTVPRWIVLFIDLFLAALTFTVAYLLTKQTGITYVYKSDFLLMLGVYLAITLGVFFLMQIHTGLIRFTNSQDMLRIFVAVLICNLAFGGIYGYIFPPIGFSFNKLALLLVINFSTKASLMIFLRTAVRSLYYYIKYNSSANKKTVLIYGTSHNSLLLKQALEGSKTGNFYIAGFVEINSPKIDKFIEQRKVYALAALDKIAGRLNVERLIIADEKLDGQIKQQLIESCLQAGIKISSVPPSDKWLADEGPVKQIKDLKIQDLLSRKPIVIDNEKINSELSGKRILITGAAGSIGSEIMRQVLKFNPAMLILCDQSESPLHEIGLEVEEIAPSCIVNLFIADVRNYKRMRALFREFRPEIIFHAAAYKHVPLMENNPAEAIQTNVGGTKNLADLAVYFDADKFVMISTDKAVNPTNIMGASKRIAEIYIQSLNDAIRHGFNYLNSVGGFQSYSTATVNTRFITTRFGNVLGSNGSVIPRFKAQIKKGGPVTVTHPEITRYFMTIPEAVQLVLEAGATEQGGKIFVFDMGEPVKISDMAKKMIKLAGFVPGTEIEIVYTGLRPGEKLYEELLNNQEYTQPTHHEKIKVANVRNYDYKDVVVDVEVLLQLVEKGDEDEIVKKMKMMVPEYLSNNSYFEKLDKEPI
jgi:FlaA1/EpsC-like NDP-sugar epimerase